MAVCLFTRFLLIIILVLASHPTEGNKFMCTPSKKILKINQFRLSLI